MKANRICHKQKYTAKNHACATVVELLQFQNDLRPLNDFIASVTYVKSTERRSRQRRNRRSICDPPRLCFFLSMENPKVRTGEFIESVDCTVRWEAIPQSVCSSIFSLWFVLKKSRAQNCRYLTGKNIFAFLFGRIYCNQPALFSAQILFFQFLGRFSPSLNEELLHRCLPRPRSLDRSM